VPIFATGCTYALVCAHLVYLYCPTSLLHVCVSQVVFTPTCVGRRGLEAGSFSACAWLALVDSVGGYDLAGVEIGLISCVFLYFVGVRVVGGYVLVYARVHTQTTWVLHVSPGVRRTPGEPEEFRSNKEQYICRKRVLRDFR